MHGRLKVRTTEEEKVIKNKERAKKVVAFKAGFSLLLNKRTKKEYDTEALEVSSQLLSANPDVYSVWNYRREIILSLISRNDSVEITKLFDSELYLTEICLKVNPKSYCAWYQRIWVLNTRPYPDWEKELKLCNTYLKLDERNFHCWDYRRHVVSCSNVDSENEFKYSTEKIHENFSNYSAWHYRSKLLTKLYPDKEGVRPIEEKHLRDELELVLNAAFTDPNDTSAWFYQRWLLGASSKPVNVGVCRVTATKSFVAFNQYVPCPSFKNNVAIKIDDVFIDGNWKPLFGLKRDVLWILEHNQPIVFETTSKILVVLSVDGIEISQVNCENTSNGEYTGYAVVKFDNIFGSSVIDELNSQMESCEQLLELEPDSKWTHLTLSVIQHSVSHVDYYNGFINILEKLTELDSKRSNYYKDLCSKWHIEYFLQTNFDSVKEGKFINEQIHIPMKLSSLYHLQYWSVCPEIDLSNQRLTSHCLPMMRVLQNCQVLNLNNNCLDSLKGFPVMPELKTIYLNGNNINSKDVEILSSNLCPKLENIVFQNETQS